MATNQKFRDILEGWDDNLEVYFDGRTTTGRRVITDNFKVDVKYRTPDGKIWSIGFYNAHKKESGEEPKGEKILVLSANIKE